MVTAGPWRRFFAHLFDSFLCMLVANFSLHAFLSEDQLTGFMYIGILLYHAFFESSSLQATPGEYLLKIKITSLSQDRISFGRALLRGISQWFVACLFAVALLLLFLAGAFLVGVVNMATGLSFHDIMNHPPSIATIIIIFTLIAGVISLGFCLSYARLCSSGLQSLQDYFSSTYMQLVFPRKE
jgi:uncharacterized RDD family membrane protein YckC